ncbi:Ubiquitin carboxyl-terminal hydrolase [Lachancea thermotolerans]
MNRLYSPEYSNELLQFVKDVYTQDIAHYFPKLRLEKLIDLLEHAEYLFESYRHALAANQAEDLLTAFVAGCFYIYLIIPHSIQFQSRDKSYAIYADLKKYYQDEANMTNVLLMVTEVIESMSKDEVETARIMRKRAYSVPYGKSPVTIQALSKANSATVEPDAPTETEFENGTTMWTAPELEPNDHLKVSLGSHHSSTSSASSNEQFPKIHNESHSFPFEEPELHALSLGGSRTRRSSVPARASRKQGTTQASNSSDFNDQKINRYATHRKDSYHSVHMSNDDYDAFTFNLARLQKQSVVTCDQLMRILCSQDRDNLLLIDLRFSKRFQTNHILAPNLLNVDPTLLWNQNKGSPIESDVQLERTLNNKLLNARSQFEYIVYYTDMKTFMKLDFDYQLVFFQLIYTSNKNLKCTPKVLLGGYEQWKKFLSKSSQAYCDKDAFLYSSTNNGRNAPVTSHSLPEHYPVAPPSIPPPPPPIAKTEEMTKTPYNRAPFPTPLVQAQRADHFPASSQNHTRDKNEIQKHSVPALSGNGNYSKHTAIPTIEQSPNEYVALSITGLRNIGCTCYVNSMLQCLFATKAFRDLFLSTKYEHYFSRKYTNPNQLSKYFNVLFKKMYMNGGCSVVPTGFLKACNALRPDFRIPHDQQDTQEFLLFLLSQLHDELSESNRVANDYPGLLLHDDKKLDVDQKEYDTWFEKHISENGISPIDNIFQGQMENGLFCQRCGHSSFNYSVFYVLSLAIPSSTSTFSQRKKVRLEDCINLFTSDEQLTNENAWDCPKCGTSASGTGPEEEKKKKRFLLNPDTRASGNRSRFFKLRSKSRSRSVSPFRKQSSQQQNLEKLKSKKLTTIKTLNFISLPTVLTIHLSRFFYDLTKKNNKVITYPLILSIVLKNEQVIKYRLYAIANHFGNLISGHYTSLVNKDLDHNLNKGKQKWYYFDDETVKKDVNHGDIDAGITSISSSDVYVLFYEKIDESQ